MGFQDNSPTRSYARWSNVKVFYEGFAYPVKDGFSNKRYVYWSIISPYELLSSDTFPNNYNEIVLINNNGVCSSYPSSNIIVDGNVVLDTNITLVSHISNNKVHFTANEKQMFHQIGEKAFKNEELIKALGDIVTELTKRIEVLERG